MDGIGHFENMLARIISKVGDNERLDLDDRLEYCVSLYEINKIKGQVEGDPIQRQHYERQARKYHRKARQYEIKLGIMLI